jgi:Rrf2 family protein
MLCLSKKTEYALVALAYLAEQANRVASAREIAQAHSLPVALLMNILKNLQGHGLLQSTRGVKGGYRIQADLAAVTLDELIAMVDCCGHASEGDCGCLDQVQADVPNMDLSSRPIHGPVQALQLKLAKFLKDVRVADLVLPGRRIDVPLERLNRKQNTNQPQRRLSHADYAQ